MKLLFRQYFPKLNHLVNSLVAQGIASSKDGQYFSHKSHNKG